MKEKKISEEVRKRLKPFIDVATQSLLNELEEVGVLVRQLDSKATITYKFRKHEASEGTSFAAPKIATEVSIAFEQLFELRNTIRAVYPALELGDARDSHNKPVGKLFEALLERGVFKTKVADKKEVLHLLDSMENISGDPGLRDTAVRDLLRWNFKPAVIANEMLEFTGLEKLKKHFADFEFNIPGAIDTGADVIMRKNEIGTIAAQIKVRKGDPLPDSQSILSALRIFESPASPNFVLMIVFTHENAGSFQRLQYQFRQLLLNEFKDHQENIEKLKLIPVWTQNMPAFDAELENFRRAYIEDKFNFEFKDQPTPRGFVNRNDHFLDRTFEVGKTELNILIRPGETKFWRFGLRMIKGDTFPLLNQERHNEEDENVGDVHICVGEPESPKDPYVWGSPNVLTLTEYGKALKIYSEDFGSILDYGGEPVRMLIRPIGEFMTSFEVYAGDRPVRKKHYITRDFKYCRLAAWCDQKEFKLVTEIEVKFRK